MQVDCFIKISRNRIFVFRVFLMYLYVQYFSTQIKLEDSKDIRVTDFNEFLNIHQGFYYNAMKELVLTKITKLSGLVLYWDLPKRFLGNQVNIISVYKLFTFFPQSPLCNKQVLKLIFKMHYKCRFFL